MENAKRFEDTNYFVTYDGQVIGPRGRPLKPKLTDAGYHEVQLYAKPKTIYTTVHRLVAKVYIPNPENKPCVNHIDGNKLNNSVDNLEWVTYQENMEHAKIHDLVHRGERNKRSIHTEEQVHEICKLLQFGYRNTDIARSLGIESYNVSLIRNGTCWMHISCQYNIPKKSRSLSDETMHWLCYQIASGLTRGEILKKSINPRITKSLIDDVRRRRIYSDISSQYF